MTRQKHFTDEEELLYFFEEYLQECEEANKSPNLAGFARKCYCDKWTLLNYKEEGHPYSHAMKKIYTFLEDATINNGMSDNFKKFYMVNTFRDYSDTTKVEAKNENVNVNTEVDDDDFIQQLKEKYLKGK